MIQLIFHTVEIQKQPSAQPYIDEAPHHHNFSSNKQSTAIQQAQLTHEFLSHIPTQHGNNTHPLLIHLSVSPNPLFHLPTKPHLPATSNPPIHDVNTYITPPPPPFLPPPSPPCINPSNTNTHTSITDNPTPSPPTRRQFGAPNVTQTRPRTPRHPQQENLAEDPTNLHRTDHRVESSDIQLSEIFVFDRQFDIVCFAHEPRCEGGVG
jgi:hypothetical protein